MNCKYCGAETSKEYCCFECRKKYLDYYDEEDKTRARVRPLLIMSAIVSIPFIIFFYGLGATIMFVLLGLTIITHPFGTENMKRNMTPKARKSRMITIGLALIVIGLPFLLLIHIP